MNTGANIGWDGRLAGRQILPDGPVAHPKIRSMKRENGCLFIASNTSIRTRAGPECVFPMVFDWILVHLFTCIYFVPGLLFCYILVSSG